MSEFAFELELCGALEERGVDRVTGSGIVARQLGANVASPGGRILDTVVVEPGAGFDERVGLTGAEIPDAALESDVGPGHFRYWKRAFDCHPERAASAVERAVEIGFFERERRNGRAYVRQVARYPAWFGEIVGIENKPDLGRPGDLEAQLRTDVSLALVDRAVLATESYVTGAHRNRIPPEVGIWRVHRDEAGVSEIEVLREARKLAVDEPGIEVVASFPGRTDVAVANPEEKARARRRLAERAYGKGWRTYGFPECSRCERAAVDGATLPRCSWHDRVVDAGSECGPDCDGYEEGAAQDVDLAAERAANTPWIADPAGRRRRQSGLDRFS